MKPHRVKMTHNLLLNYGLYKDMTVYRPHLCSQTDMAKFHSDDYVEFLRRITPDNMHEYSRQLQRFNVGEDCPVFDGLYEFCQISSGGSIGAAVKLNHGQSDIAINWSGGLHHAKKSEASGFCYINDIVLSILELLKYHARVLYIDIDIHHGDGVEEAFYTTDRVMTVSFHKFGDYFPGTGDLQDIGSGPGRYYSVNFPLKDGIDDHSFRNIFRPVMTKVMQVYNPGAVVLQCGADSLAGDRLGCFNLSIEGHADCVEFMKTFNTPLLVLGGGGYTIKNVARCWTYETAVLLGKKVKNEMPFNDYFEYFGPDYQLTIPTNSMENANSYEYLEKTKNTILSNLGNIKGAPSVQMQDVPPDTFYFDTDDENDDPDVRLNQRVVDNMVQHPAEFYEHDFDNDKGLDVNEFDEQPQPMDTTE